MNAKELAENVCRTLDNHKAEDIVTIDVSKKTVVADYFVVASGRSMTHTRSLIELLDEELGKMDIVPLRSEGVKEGRWAVLDYGDVVVHIFNDETRLFYCLEELWSDKKTPKK